MAGPIDARGEVAGRLRIARLRRGDQRCRLARHVGRDRAEAVGINVDHRLDLLLRRHAGRQLSRDQVLARRPTIAFASAMALP
jgi:hypothetical protein